MLKSIPQEFHGPAVGTKRPLYDRITSTWRRNFSIQTSLVKMLRDLAVSSRLPFLFAFY